VRLRRSRDHPAGALTHTDTGVSTQTQEAHSHRHVGLTDTKELAVANRKIMTFYHDTHIYFDLSLNHTTRTISEKTERLGDTAAGNDQLVLNIKYFNTM
jgi:hypothetical protein